MAAARRPPPTAPGPGRTSDLPGTAPGSSLTQPNARSGRVCESCGDERLTEIGMTLTDGTRVVFASCHHCEAKRWRKADTDEALDLSFDTVLEHTRRPR